MTTHQARTFQALQFWGDSLTAGYGTFPGRGWVAQLSRRFPRITMYNHGVCGRLFSDILAEAWAVVHYPDPREALFLMGGTNDILCGIRYDSLCRTVEQEITALSARIPIVLGVPLLTTRASIAAGWQMEWQFEDNNETLRLYADFLRSMAEQHGLVLLDFQQHFPCDDAFYSDGVHPNERGYTCMADLAEAVLRPLLPQD